MLGLQLSADCAYVNVHSLYNTGQVVQHEMHEAEQAALLVWTLAMTAQTLQQLPYHCLA